MNSFKQTLENDLATFVNAEEFADTCIFNLGGEDVTVPAVIDSSIASDFAGAQIRGVFTATLVVYIRQGGLSPLPPVGSVLTLNGMQYFCRDLRVEQGLDVLTLERKLQ